ncbi:hypothetical protein GQX74_010322 [Glossina fuscipes]|nr:hypothetical protein GQX74_010322 [Glossina fuscipes]
MLDQNVYNTSISRDDRKALVQSQPKQLIFGCDLAFESGPGRLLDKKKFTFKKNKSPEGISMRCEPESVFSSWPSLNHCIEGVGLPSALQLNVKGSFFGTTISMGCSMIRGFCAAEKRTNKRISLSGCSLFSKVKIVKKADFIA